MLGEASCLDGDSACAWVFIRQLNIVMLDGQKKSIVDIPPLSVNMVRTDNLYLQ